MNIEKWNGMFRSGVNITDATEEEAKAFLSVYLEDFPPAGYGTYSKLTKLGDGKVELYIVRSSTCE